MIGIDMVYLPSFKKQLELGGTSFLEKAFQPDELQNQKLEHLAGLWAAREAVLKAAGLTVEQWLQIVINHLPSGKPEARVGAQQFEISISHDGDYAVAVALAI
jgi:holo-[acyl-carrier protein] synthase